MINVIVWPLILIIFIFLLVYVQRNVLKKLRVSRVWMILWVYIFVLFACTIAYIYVQPEKMIKSQTNNINDGWDLSSVLQQQNADVLHKIAPFKQGEWKVPMSKGNIRLEVDVSEEEPYGLYIPVLIIEQEKSGDEVQIFQYETPTLINHLDISDYVSLPKIRVEGNQIIVEDVYEVNEHELIALRYDMTLRQFTKTEEFQQDLQVGEMAIVLIVPEGKAVVADENYFDVLRY